MGGEWERIAGVWRRRWRGREGGKFQHQHQFKAICFTKTAKSYIYRVTHKEWDCTDDFKLFQNEEFKVSLLPRNFVQSSVKSHPLKVTLYVQTFLTVRFFVNMKKSYCCRRYSPEQSKLIVNELFEKPTWFISSDWRRRFDHSACMGCNNFETFTTIFAINWGFSSRHFVIFLLKTKIIKDFMFKLRDFQKIVKTFPKFTWVLPIGLAYLTFIRYKQTS